MLLDEARALLDQADRPRVRVAATTGVATITVGILGDSTDPVGAVLAHRRSAGPPRPPGAGRPRWFQFPPGTDPVWQVYWNGGEPREGPVVRVVQECLQAVLWNGMVGIAPLGHDQPEHLAVVPLIDMAPSRVVTVWKEGDTNPLIQSFVQIGMAVYRDSPPSA